MNKSLEDVILSTAVKGLRSVIILFLSVGFLGIGMLKLVNMPEIADYFKVWNMPKFLMYLVGIFEVSLSIAIFYLPTRIYAIMGVILLMIGATGVHLVHEEYSYLIGPACIIAAAAILYFIEKNQQVST